MRTMLLAIVAVVAAVPNLGCKNPGVKPDRSTAQGETYRLDDFPRDMKPHRVETPQGAATLVSGPALSGQGASAAKQPTGPPPRESAGTVSLIGAQDNEPGLWCRLALEPAGSPGKAVLLRFPPDQIAGIAATLKECAATAREWGNGASPGGKYPRRAGRDFRSRDGNTLTIRANQQKAGQTAAVVFVGSDARAYTWVWTTDLDAVESLRQGVLGIQAWSRR